MIVGLDEMSETKKREHSLFERLMWLPLFTAPVSKTFPKIILLTLACGGAAAAIVGKSAIVKGALIGWIVGCWLVSLTYKET